MESPLHPPSRIFPTRGVVSFIPFHSFHAFIHSSRGLCRSSSRSSSVVDVVDFVEEEDRDGTRRPTRAFVGGDGSLSSRVSLSLSRDVSLSRCLSLARARARAIDGASASSSPSSNASSNARTHPRTHARTNARIHPCIHSCIHASSVPTLRRRRGWISRDARRETSSRDVVARLETREREERERGERCRSPNRATEDDDGRTATPRRRFDSIRFRHLILI